MNVRAPRGRLPSVEEVWINYQPLTNVTMAESGLEFKILHGPQVTELLGFLFTNWQVSFKLVAFSFMRNLTTFPCFKYYVCVKQYLQLPSKLAAGSGHVILCASWPTLRFCRVPRAFISLTFHKFSFSLLVPLFKSVGLSQWLSYDYAYGIMYIHSLLSSVVISM